MEKQSECEGVAGEGRGGITTKEQHTEMRGRLSHRADAHRDALPSAHHRSHPRAAVRRSPRSSHISLRPLLASLSLRERRIGDMREVARS